MIVRSFLHNGSRRTDPQSLLELASEANDGAKFVCDLLRQFEIVTLELDDGTRAQILAANLVPGNAAASEKYFTVTNISDGENFRVRVADGSFTAPNVEGIEAANPTLTALMESNAVDGGEFDVSDGSKVYLKLTITKTPVTREPTTEGSADPAAALLTVSGRTVLTVWHATAGTVVVQTGTPSNTEALCYIKIATTTITDGTLTIRQHRDGEIDTPTVTSLTSTLDIAGETDELTVCNSGTPVDMIFLTTPA